MNSNPFSLGKAPRKPKTYTNESVMEALRGLSGGVGKTVTKDVVGKVGADALTSILGNTPKQQGELRPNQPVIIPDKQVTPEPQPERFHPEYLTPEARPVAPRTIMHEDREQLNKQIESIRHELKTIATSIQSLNSDIGKAVHEVPVNPGVYHANFFERLKAILIVLREQIDDSRSWLALSVQKKQKKMGYWGMFKKHGTSFGLSNERSLATSAG